MQMKSFPVHITTVLSIIISDRTVNLRRLSITTFRFNLFSAHKIYRYLTKLSNGSIIFFLSSLEIYRITGIFSKEIPWIKIHSYRFKNLTLLDGFYMWAILPQNFFYDSKPF